jgi:anion-transporting  ArsA/GET3 family ATPase
MLIDSFLRPRILIVAGKGGVGKTTVSAALALVAARAGRKVCVVEVDRKGALPRLFGGGELDYEPTELAPGVWGLNILLERALAEYLDVQYHVRRISRMFSSPHFVDYITTAAPGLKDILVLGKVWYLEQGRSSPGERNFDTIILDAPATGHMLSFLSAPLGLADAVQVGPVRRQSDWLIDMLRDHNRTRVHMVTLAEEMPVIETIETAAALGNRIRVGAGAVFANALYMPPAMLLDDEQPITPGRVRSALGTTDVRETRLTLEAEDVDALVAYARFISARRRIQDQHLRHLRRSISEPVAELPFLFSAGLALPDVERLADVIEAEIGKL